MELNVSIELCEYYYEVLDQIKKEKLKIDRQLDNFKGDRGVIEQFKLRLSDFRSQQQIYKDHQEREIDVKLRHDTLKKKRTDEFNAGLTTINYHLKSMF